MLLKLWFCLGMTENHTASCYNQKSIIFFKQLTPWNSKFSLNWKYFTYVAMVRWHTQPFIGLTFETCSIEMLSIEMLNTWSNSVIFPGNVMHKQLNIFPSKHCSPCWTDCLWILVTRDLWNPFCVEWSLRPSFATMPPLMASPCHGDEETELSTCIADVQAWSMEPLSLSWVGPSLAVSASWNSRPSRRACPRPHHSAAFAWRTSSCDRQAGHVGFQASSQARSWLMFESNFGDVR